MRGFALILIACSAALAACQPVPNPAASGGPVTGAVATLAGEWRVAAIDGQDFDDPHVLALRGDAERLWWDPICAAQVRRYRIDGSRIALSSAYTRETAPQVICLIAPPARLAEVMRALDAAETVARTPENGILISGGGRSVLLFSQ